MEEEGEGEGRGEGKRSAPAPTRSNPELAALLGRCNAVAARYGQPVLYAWAAAGVSLPHYTVSQYEDTERITAAELQPGDLVFYDNYSGPQPGHVAMYIGNGQVVHASTETKPVYVTSVSGAGPNATGHRVTG